MTIKESALKQHFEKPGLRPNEKRYRDTELLLAEAIGDVFTINHAAAFNDLSIWLVKGTDAFNARFSLDREIIVVYCRHNKTDARVLRALEEFAKTPKYASRVDRVLALLFYASEDDSEAQKVCQSKDWVYVPLSIRGLLNQDAGKLIHHAVSLRLGRADLFGMQSAIEADTYFFGRHDLVQKIAGRGEMGRNNHGVFGLRKMGKTSVLFAVERRLASRPVITTYIDAHLPGTYQRRWWSMLELIAKRCAKSRGAEAIIGRGRYTQAEAAVSFTDDITALLERSDVEQILLLLDEIEYITPGLAFPLGEHWEEDYFPFWQTIRGVHQETKGGLCFVIAGVNPSAAEDHAFGGQQNPIFQLPSQHLLEPFDRNQIVEMVSAIGRYVGMHLDDDAYDFLLNHCAGHPYLTRVACSAVAQSLPNSDVDVHCVSANHFKRNLEEIDGRLTTPIKDILASFIWWFHEEYELLEMWAKGDHDFVREYLQSDPRMATLLKRWGVIRDDQLAIPRMKSFLVEQGRGFELEMIPFSKSDVSIERLLKDETDLKNLTRLAKLRFELERSLRRVILLVLGSRHGFNDSATAQSIIASLPQRNDRPPASNLFIGRQPSSGLQELYMSDLSVIIGKNWELFEAFFGGNRKRFNRDFLTANDARVSEAHTKDLTTEEVEAGCDAYNWLLSGLRNIPM